MANHLFNTFGNNNQFGDLIKQAQEFKRQFTNINPRAEVERLLQTGQMSQSDFNRFSQIAQQVVQAMGEDL